MRLTLLGHLSSFGGQWGCPVTVLAMMFEALQDRVKCLLSRLVTGGFLKSRRYAVGSSVIALDNLEHPSSAPFHFQPTSTCESKLQERLARNRLTWTIVCSLLYRSLASRGRRLISPWSNGPVIARCQEMIPRGWVEFYGFCLILS